uniref:Uncharacterized protein n=1 Tax=Entomoneis paludosa TaxID=265537 RepID=A0A7S2Y140_9STRA|mmetsp:Transcript_1023/g.2324  ORF Transcript_1023/g.2324 Transcript_1023/m.2324 type:complete len:268 (+) Transcript_1023:110-913(+)
MVSSVSSIFILFTLVFGDSTVSGFAPAPRRATPNTAVHLIPSGSKTTVAEPRETSTTPSETNDLATRLQTSSFSYVDFAQTNPFANNLLIATTKTAAADFLAQTVVAQVPLAEVDWQRSLLFCLFGCLYLGGFQYFYQVQVFKKSFDVEGFTQQSLSEKLVDTQGLQALAAQTALDLTVLTVIYLPTFYIFKASVFGGTGTIDPATWISTGLHNYQSNFAKDEWDLLRVWFPADLVCFSVPLYLRLPVRHIVSFVWTAYLSFSRGGH